MNSANYLPGAGDNKGVIYSVSRSGGGEPSEKLLQQKETLFLESFSTALFVHYEKQQHHYFTGSWDVHVDPAVYHKWFSLHRDPKISKNRADMRTSLLQY